MQEKQTSKKETIFTLQINTKYQSVYGRLRIFRGIFNSLPSQEQNLFTRLSYMNIPVAFSRKNKSKNNIWDKKKLKIIFLFCLA
jgi:hypothetical protein